MQFKYLYKKEQIDIPISDSNRITGVMYSISNPDAIVNIDFVLIHAFPLTRDLYTNFFPESDQWRDMVNIISAKCNFRVFFPDLPGFGTTDPFKKSPLDLNPYVEAIFQLVKKYQCSILLLGGCSLGGYIALEFLRKHASKVRGLILIDTKPSADSKEVKENRLENVELMQNVSNELSRTSNKKATNPLQMFDLVQQNAMVKKWLENLCSNLVSDDTRTNFSKRVGQLNEIILKQNPRGIMDALLAMAGRVDTQKLLVSYLTPLSPPTQTSDRYTIKSNPVLILAGESDKLTPISLWKDFLDVNLYPNLSIQTIPNAAHLSPLENPDAFYRILFEWLHDTIQIK